MADEKKSSIWLRILEIIAGLIILVLAGYVIAYPGVAVLTLILFLSIALIVLGIAYFIRVFAKGISGWRRLLNLILSGPNDYYRRLGNRQSVNLRITDACLSVGLSIVVRRNSERCARYSRRHHRRDTRNYHRLCRDNIPRARLGNARVPARGVPDNLRIRVDNLRHSWAMGLTYLLLRASSRT